MTRRSRALFIVLATLSGLLTAASPALATSHAGQGIYGSTNDVVITMTMFGLIAFFPAVIVVFSLIQAWLDHRKHARYDAMRRHETSAEWRGGW